MTFSGASCYEEYWVKNIDHVQPGVVVRTLKKGGLIYEIRTAGNRGTEFDAAVVGKYKTKKNYRVIPRAITATVFGWTRKIDVVAASGLKGLKYVDVNKATAVKSWDLPKQALRYDGLLYKTGKKNEISIIGSYRNGCKTRLVPATALGRGVVSVGGLKGFSYVDLSFATSLKKVKLPGAVVRYAGIILKDWTVTGFYRNGEQDLDPGPDPMIYLPDNLYGRKIKLPIKVAIKYNCTDLLSKEEKASLAPKQEELQEEDALFEE
jgi:hypothetical protein